MTDNTTTDEVDYDLLDEQATTAFNNRVLQLISAELLAPTNTAAEVLFHIERMAPDWTPEMAVACLFRYASAYGWGDVDQDDHDFVEQLAQLSTDRLPN